MFDSLRVLQNSLKSSGNSEARAFHRSAAWKMALPAAWLAVVGCSHPAVQPTPSIAAAPPFEQGWVELGSDGGWIARAATDQKDCPPADVDGTYTPLKLRAQSVEGSKTILVCEAALPKTAHVATIFGEKHTLDLKTLQKIVVIGDTGCRIKARASKMDIQDCNSSDAWPFEKMLNEQIIPLHPDLIVHVGDYHYRESECPAGNPKCEGAVSGDNIDSWRQDFFRPAHRALNRFNWLFVRGNHEICNRAGKSWFLFLDSQAYTPVCSDATDPLMATIGDTTLAWADAADDANIQPSLEKLAPKLPAHSFLFLHRPFLTAGADDEAKVQSHLPSSMLKKHQIAAVVTGHKHYFSFNQFTDQRPFEIISGNGGTKLLKPDDDSKLKDGWTKSKDQGTRMATYWKHGFLTLERSGRTWTAVEHDVEGKVIFTHRITR